MLFREFNHMEVDVAHSQIGVKRNNRSQRQCFVWRGRIRHTRRPPLLSWNLSETDLEKKGFLFPHQLPAQLWRTCCLSMYCSRANNIYFYYIDASVLLEGMQWHIFYILTGGDINDVFYRFLHWIYIIKRKLLGGLKLLILSSRGDTNILLIRLAHS